MAAAEEVTVTEVILHLTKEEALTLRQTLGQFDEEHATDSVYKALLAVTKAF